MEAVDPSSHMYKRANWPATQGRVERTCTCASGGLMSCGGEVGWRGGVGGELLSSHSCDR